MSLDELERVSRFAAGDLTPTERWQFESELRRNPGLARALEQLRYLDQVLGELGAEPISASDERLVQRVAHRSRSRRRLARVFAATIAASVAAVLAFRYGRGGENEALPPKAADVASSSKQVLAMQAADVVGPRLLRAENCNVLLLTGAAARVDGPGTLELQQGTLVVDGHALVVAHGTRLAIDGLAGVSTEPGDAFLHVMQGLQSTPQGKDYQMHLSKWSGPHVVIGAASAALLVSTGTAEARTANGESVRVSAGQSWSSGKSAQTTVASAQRSQSASSESGLQAKRAFLEKNNALIEAFQPSLPAITRCYTEALARKPDLEGSIIARVKIAAGQDGLGKVAEATIDKDYTLASPLVASCALEELSRARLPAPTNGNAEVEIPLVFSLGENGGEPRVQLAKSVEAPTIPTVPATQTIQLGNAPSRGPNGAAVTVVEFSDPECPYCGRVHEAINALYNELGGRVRFALIFAPLPFHRKAPIAAAAAYAADQQGKFWEFVDALFSHPDALDRHGLERMAAQLGLDTNKFNQSLDSQRFAPIIEANQRQADALGVNATPVLFINGRPLVGAVPIEKIRAKIMEALDDPGRQR